MKVLAVLMALLLCAGMAQAKFVIIEGPRTIGSGSSGLTMSQIVGGIGNYSQHAPSICYTNGTGCPPSSGDNSSWNEGLYWSNATASFYPLLSNPNGYLTSYTETDPKTATMPNLTYAQIAANIGNWSADKASYVLISGLAGAVGQNLTMAAIKNNMGNASQLAGNCGAGNFLQNISFIGGTFALQCAADQTGAGGYISGSAGWDNTTTTITTNGAKNVTITGTLALNSRLTSQDNMYAYNTAEVHHSQMAFCDFTVPYATTGCYPYLFGTVRGTGGIMAVDSTKIDNTTFGVWSVSGGTGITTGYSMASDLGIMLLYGNEEYKQYYRVNMSRPGNTSNHILGFMDTTNASVHPVDGAYILIEQNVTYGQVVNLSCWTASNSVRTGSPNTTLSLNSWYWFTVKVNSTATGITCRALNTTGVQWEANVTGTLPTTAGRQTGFGFVVNSGAAPVSAAPVGFVDTIIVEVERTLRPTA